MSEEWNETRRVLLDLANKFPGRPIRMSHQFMAREHSPCGIVPHDASGEAVEFFRKDYAEKNGIVAVEGGHTFKMF